MLIGSVFWDLLVTIIWWNLQIKYEQYYQFLNNLKDKIHTKFQSKMESSKQEEQKASEVPQDQEHNEEEEPEELHL